jgi:hypothetical protein
VFASKVWRNTWSFSMSWCKAFIHFNQEREDRFRKRVKHYTGIWCCVTDHTPGHIYYDMYWDEKPGWKPIPPQTSADDHPPWWCQLQNYVCLSSKRYDRWEYSHKQKIFEDGLFSNSLWIPLIWRHVSNWHMWLHSTIVFSQIITGVNVMSDFHICISTSILHSFYASFGFYSCWGC